ncbi:MAG: hypothetical protein V1800_15870 [Candidatus Latescibacterota bacterium]
MGLCQENGIAQAPIVAFGKPTDRADRLIAIKGVRPEEWVAEISSDGGHEWHPATIYLGATPDDCRTCDKEIWNRGVLEGMLPAGNQPCVWNCFFDVAMPMNRIGIQTDGAGARCIGAGDQGAYVGAQCIVPLHMRLMTTGTGEVVFDQSFDRSTLCNGFVVDHRNVAGLAGGRLPEPWSLKLSSLKKRGSVSLVGQVESEPYDSEYPTCHVKNADLPPLVIWTDLEGWHRVYVGMEPITSVRFSLSEEQVSVPIPGEHEQRLFREYCVAEADLTGQDIHLELGGIRVWPDAWVHHIRFVHMTDRESAEVLKTRQLAQEKGRPFAGYLEPMTDGYYIGETIKLRDYIRNEMRLHQLRGCTEVYFHAIRIGFSAWYHSDVIERYQPEGEAFQEQDSAQLKWTEWMRQGDPMALAVEEARKAGLGIFADVGMNITYLGTKRFHYRSMTARFAKEHPEYMCPDHPDFFDFRHAPVRDYAVAIAGELVTKYDVVGIHLDFARFACNQSFDEDSLVNVVERIHAHRLAAQKKWGHPLPIAIRIPSYLYHHWKQYAGDFAEFVAALKVWTQNGWFERLMVCCMLPDQFPELSIRRYLDAISGTSVAMWGDLHAGFSGKSSGYFRNLARTWSQEGLGGGFFFYDAGQPIELRQLNRQLRLVDLVDK